jgi:zinc protease
VRRMEVPPSPVRRRTLDSGLSLVVSGSPATPMFAAILSVEAGSRYDERERSGLAALTSGLLAERPGDDGALLDRRIDSLGLSLDADAGYETSALVATGLARHADEALDLLCELVSSPRFDEGTVEDAVDRQLTEIAEEEDDPYCVCRRALFEEVFGEHARGRPVVGYEPAVRALGLADVAGFHDLHYRPGHSVLAVVGGVDPERTLDAASRAFERWTGPSVDRDRPPPRVVPNPRSRFVPMERAQVHVAIGNLGIARSDPAYHAVLVMDAILGDGAGFGSRLASRLREVAGLAYLIESDTASTAGIDPGVFWVYTATSPSRVEAALAAVRDELERIRREPPSAIELSSAKAYVRGREILGLETNEAKAGRLIRIERHGLGQDYGERFAGLIGAVTADGVLAAARRVIDPDRAATVLVGPPADPGESGNV